VQRVAQAETLDGFSFENVNELADEIDNASASKLIWDELVRASFVRSDESLILKAKREACAVPAAFSWMEGLGKRRAKYVRLARGTTLDAAGRDVHSVLKATLDTCFGDKEKQLEVERESYPLLIWLALGLRGRQVQYRLSFDSIQHTHLLKMDLGKSSTGTERARTSFSAGWAKLTKMNWADKQWSPISSGFLIAGE
jgi:hypothetical protein